MIGVAHQFREDHALPLMREGERVVRLRPAGLTFALVHRDVVDRPGQRAAPSLDFLAFDRGRHHRPQAEVCRQAVGREVVPIVVDEDELAGAAAAVDAGRLVDALERRVVRQRAVAQGDTQRAGDALADRARGDDLRGLQEGELLVDGERALRPGSGRQPDQHDAREPGEVRMSGFDG